jgi:hypothetical protein
MGGVAISADRPVVGESRGDDRERSAPLVIDATAEPVAARGADGLVVGQNTVGDGQRSAGIVDTGPVSGPAVRYGQVGDVNERGAAADLEDAVGVIAADGQLIGIQPLDIQALGDHQLAVQRDGLAGQATIEVDGVTALSGGNLTAQGAVAGNAGVGVVGDRQCAGHDADFQGFESGHDPLRAPALRPTTCLDLPRSLSVHCLQPLAEKERHDRYSLK